MKRFNTAALSIGTQEQSLATPWQCFEEQQQQTAATVEINAPERAGETINIPMAAATKIYAGTIVCRDTSGNAVPGSDTASLKVLGRAEETVDNTSGSAGDLKINVKRGVFRWNNSGSDAVDADDEGKVCFVEDDNTVNEAGGTNRVAAGVVIDVDSDGVWVDTSRRLLGGVSTVATTAATNSTPYGFSQAQADGLVAAVNTIIKRLS